MWDKIHGSGRVRLKHCHFSKDGGRERFLTETLEISISSKMLTRQRPRLDHRRAHTRSGKNQTKCGRSACLSCGSHAPADVLRKQLLSLCISFFFLKWGWFVKVAIFPVIVSEFTVERPRLDNAQCGPNCILELMPLCLATCVCVCVCVCVFSGIPDHFLHDRDS